MSQKNSGKFSNNVFATSSLVMTRKIIFIRTSVNKKAEVMIKTILCPFGLPLYFFAKKKPKTTKPINIIDTLKRWDHEKSPLYGTTKRSIHYTKLTNKAKMTIFDDEKHHSFIFDNWPLT